ncbi:MAG: ABC transporter permease subunit [Hyphomicrobiaceae bacterium TMED74]|nr:ABC transporter permease [Filomicrobium sp.]RPG37025.1 MAG: ABC transporter permease subunit [Hyphomicrobiaceae bacterium TMED74]
MSNARFSFLLILPALIICAAFLILPLAQLILVSLEKGSIADGTFAATYREMLTTPRYLSSLLGTVILSVSVTLVTLAISTLCGLLLARNRFVGRELLTALLTFPLVFPGVVVGFMVIMLGGRQGLLAYTTMALDAGRVTFAYSMTGLFVGYLYFSIPRVLLTVMAAIEKLDGALEEAARSLGASPLTVLKDIILPALMPAFLASGAVCFATAMGAFGTAFTLATDIDVLPMVIYTEFTLNANIAMAAALSLLLGVITWIMLSIARAVGGTSVAAAA